MSYDSLLLLEHCYPEAPYPKGNQSDMIERKRNMILSKDATRVTHQPSTCIDNIIRRTIEHYEFSVFQESFSLQYLLSLSCCQKSVATSERVTYRNTAIFENPMKMKGCILFLSIN